MPKVAPLINDFSAGEFGPLASARVDLDRYKSSLDLMQRFIPTLQGGAVKGSGTKYVAACKSSASKSRLERFVLSTEQAYVIEFADSYIRFFKNNAQILSGGTPYQIASPYTATEVFDLTFCQSNQFLYVFHPSHAPRKLMRFSDTSWSLGEFLGYTGPFLSYPYYNAVTSVQNNHQITSSAASGATTLSFSALAGFSAVQAHTTGEVMFRVGTVQWLVTNDRIVVSGVTGTVEANGVWSVDYIGNGWTVLKGSVFVNAWTGGGSATFAPFAATDVGRRIKIYDPTGTPDQGWVTCVITGYTNQYTVSATIENNNFSVGPIATNIWALGLYSDTTGYPAAGCFHDDRLVMVGPSQYIVGSRTADYENFLQCDLVGTVVASNAYVFALNSNGVSNCRWVISDERGLLVGTSRAEWVVKSASTTEALSPLSVDAKETTTFGSRSVYPVKSGKAIVFPQPTGRIIQEYIYYFDVDGYRANNITKLAHHISKTGVVQMALQKEPFGIIWAVRADGTLVGCTYERDQENGLKVAWHRHPLGGYSDAANNAAIVESVTSIPSADGSYDEVWITVKRWINGATVRYVEYFTKYFNEEVNASDAFFVDCGKTYDSPKTITNITKANPPVATSNAHGFNNDDEVLLSDILGMSELNDLRIIVKNKTANTFELYDENGSIDGTAFSTYVSGGYARKMVSTITGANHLEGQTVDILGDGALVSPAVVTGGQFTLANKCAKVQYGLNYKAKMRLPRLDVGAADGTAIGKTKRTHLIGVMLDRTRNLKFGTNFDTMDELNFSDDVNLGQAPELFTGIKTAEIEADYDTENQLCFMSDKPLPCTILAVMPRLHTQDG